MRRRRRSSPTTRLATRSSPTSPPAPIRLRKVSVVPRGRALGVTVQMPDEDRYNYSRTYLLGRLAGMLGGRAAEMVVYGEITTGAENDLKQATSLARRMVGLWGMSEDVGAGLPRYRRGACLPRPRDHAGQVVLRCDVGAPRCRRPGNGRERAPAGARNQSPAP